MRCSVSPSAELSPPPPPDSGRNHVQDGAGGTAVKGIGILPSWQSLSLLPAPLEGFVWSREMALPGAGLSVQMFALESQPAPSDTTGCQ